MAPRSLLTRCHVIHLPNLIQNGPVMTPPYVWQDSITLPASAARGQVRMRTKFEEFTGEYVLHCSARQVPPDSPLHSLILRGSLAKPSCLFLTGARERSDGRSRSRAFQDHFRRRERIGKTVE